MLTAINRMETWNAELACDCKQMRKEQNRTLLPQAKVLMAGCQNSEHGHLCWLPIMT